MYQQKVADLKSAFQILVKKVKSKKQRIYMKAHLIYWHMLPKWAFGHQGKNQALQRFLMIWLLPIQHEQVNLEKHLKVQLKWRKCHHLKPYLSLLRQNCQDKTDWMMAHREFSQHLSQAGDSSIFIFVFRKFLPFPWKSKIWKATKLTPCHHKMLQSNLIFDSVTKCLCISHGWYVC